MVIKNLVLSGGSLKGYSYLGIFKYLDKNQPDFFDNIEHVLGVSIGSLIGSLFCLGYKAEELITIFSEVEEDKFRNITSDSILNFLDTFGLDDGSKLIKLIEILFKGKKCKPNITFSEFYEKTKIKFNVLACCLNTTTEVYFNHETFPDMEVIKAIRTSCSIPFIYEPVRIEDNLYVDGGIINNFPIEYFDDNIEETLGLLIIGANYYYEEITTIQEYWGSVVRNSMFKYIKNKMEKYEKQIIKVECHKSLCKITISKDEKCDLIDLGFKKTEEFYLQRSAP